MKVFDNTLIINTVLKHSENIIRAVIGMEEDWRNTAETIFENGQYTQDLNIKIATSGGINGSYWATPVIKVHLKDEKIIEYKVYTTEELLVKRAEEEQLKFRYQLLKELSSYTKELNESKEDLRSLINGTTQNQSNSN